MVNVEYHWMVALHKVCPIVGEMPSYIKNNFTPENNPKPNYKKHIAKSVDQNIDHLIQEGLSVDDIVKQMDLTNVSITRAKYYVYERKRAIGYRRKSKQMEALELMKDKKLTDEYIAKKLGMHKRYVRFLRVENSRGRLG